jgi:hypothetical protein
VALGVRSGDLGRGLDRIDLVVFDEAYNLTETEVSALTGAQLASPNSQTIYASTPASRQNQPGRLGHRQVQYTTDGAQASHLLFLTQSGSRSDRRSRRSWPAMPFRAYSTLNRNEAWKPHMNSVMVSRGIPQSCHAPSWARAGATTTSPNCFPLFAFHSGPWLTRRSRRC